MRSASLVSDELTSTTVAEQRQDAIFTAYNFQAASLFAMYRSQLILVTFDWCLASQTSVDII